VTQIAFCFPGQGAQEVGMGQAMAEASPAARAVYDECSQVLGLDLAEVSFEGPLDVLSRTDVTQPALITTELACLAAARAEGFEATHVVGHSVGEFSALVAAGSLATSDAIVLMRERGIAMAEAAEESPGAMAAVLGLDDAVVERLCAEIEGVWPANYNCPGQLVVSGSAEGVTELEERARAEGARRVVRLNVSGGFHSPLTAFAERRFGPALEGVDFATPRLAFCSTVTSGLERDPSGFRGILLHQLTAPVLFSQAVATLVADGVTTFVELGPGNVLSGLVRRIDRSLRAVSVSGPDGFAKLQAVLDG
jgi:[acyl-carrier-protein] S-malonyltransferase